MIDEKTYTEVMLQLGQYFIDHAEELVPVYYNWLEENTIDIHIIRRHPRTKEELEMLMKDVM